MEVKASLNGNYWSLVALDRWSLYRVAFDQKIRWEDYGVVVISKWSLCEGGR